MSDTKLLQEINQLGKKFSDATITMHEAIAHKAGLTGTDHKYLGVLMSNGAMTAGELSKLTGLTTGAVTGVIDRLEKRGLVKREFEKADRRKVIIVPHTEHATELLEPSFSILRKKIVALVNALSDEEQQVVEKYLRSAIRAMEEVTDTLFKS